MSLLNVNKNIIYLIFFLIPISAIFGKAVTEFLFFLFLILFVFQFFKSKILKLENKNLIYFFLIFYLFIFFNSYIQIDHSDLNISIFTYIRYIILFIGIHYLLNLENQRTLNCIFFYIIFFIVSFVIIDALIQFFLGKNLLGLKPDEYQITSFFGRKKILGTYLLYIIPIIIWWKLNFKIPLSNFTLYLFLFSSFVVIYLSGQRTSFFLIVLFIFYNLIFINYLRKIFSYSFISLVFFIIITFNFNIGHTDPSNRMFKKTFHQITNYQSKYFRDDKNLIEFLDKKNNINKLNKINMFSEDHHGHYILAKNLFLEKPIFGYGPRGFRYYCRKMNYNVPIGMCTTHPHNFIMQFLSELGFIGLIFVIISTIFIVKNFFKVLKNKELTADAKNRFLISNITLIIVFFPLLPSGNFFSSSFSIIAYYVIGLYSYSLRRLYDHK